ncbi:MAG: hypothetical protein KC680_01985 [Candidatus Peregrinibacteria bacterium]|nr:hypothetical protein [Candidatus Peregrinibacteria bacterium]MCB9808220.1 hypothetical protein [Candidatus Peribacteria bacterium]
MKKTIAKLLATGAVLSMALVPAAQAVSYYPGYTCYYRDISGSCRNYQTSDPYFFGSANRSLSPYGNRRTLNSFNAYEVHQSPWDNRYNFPPRYYEDDDDDNDYFDDNDDYIRAFGWPTSRSPKDEGWKYYYDENDDRVRPYYLETGGYHHQNGGYYEYEHTRVYIQ